MTGAHTRTGWYEECIAHPRPDNDVDDDVYDAWVDTHFEIGEFDACEDTRVGDICRECTAALQDREESDDLSVPWPCPAVKGVPA